HRAIANTHAVRLDAVTAIRRHLSMLPSYRIGAPFFRISNCITTTDLAGLSGIRVGGILAGLSGKVS
ncbi:MAG TPA: hypothetical protein VGK58_16530, partial [Lacipirellulaceae bacterium]